MPALGLDQWIQHLGRLGEPQPSDLPPDRTLLAGNRGEQLLWRACAGEAVALEALGLGAPAPRSADGPLLAPDAYLAIEVWAECELSALHALHRLVRLGHAALAPDAASRLRGAVRWHLEHTQPDNSTNRPWALHVFLLEAFRPDGGAGEAALFAETLLHNMTATDARSEPLSRWILADAARELRLVAASR